MSCCGFLPLGISSARGLDLCTDGEKVHACCVQWVYRVGGRKICEEINKIHVKRAALNDKRIGGA